MGLFGIGPLWYGPFSVLGLSGMGLSGIGLFRYWAFLVCTVWAFSVLGLSGMGLFSIGSFWYGPFRYWDFLVWAFSVLGFFGIGHFWNWAFLTLILLDGDVFFNDKLRNQNIVQITLIRILVFGLIILTIRSNHGSLN